MRAILLKEFGGVDQLYLGEAPDPIVSEDQVLIKVEATALNRADILQRKGLYPPPSGASEILGLEVAGTVVDAHKNANNLIGTRVMALLSGGGYAEYVAVNKNLVMELPTTLNMSQGAAMMEAFLTSWQALVWLGTLQRNRKVLIHAGASGVGSAAIQLAKTLGAVVIVTASSSKHGFCKELGADHCIDYHTQPFDQIITDYAKEGVDLILDFIGNKYLMQNINCLAIDGRLVMLGLLGGVQPVSLNFAPVLLKRLSILGTTLRSRSLVYRSNLLADFKKHCLDHILSGALTPVIDKVIPWEQIREAHQYMEANRNMGKIILEVN